MSKLINTETGFVIATTPEKLPPLRAGYVRVVHQTFFNYAESFVKNGLIYNRCFAKRDADSFSKYTDITSMAKAYYWDDFWEMLTKDGIKHRGANAIAIFDMPAEEMGAHQKVQITPMLNGTISRGYLVGMLPNEKLSIEDMEEKKRISNLNQLPPFYETPNWKENIEKAWKTFSEQNDDLKNGTTVFGNRKSSAIFIKNTRNL